MAEYLDGISVISIEQQGNRKQESIVGRILQRPWRRSKRGLDTPGCAARPWAFECNAVGVKKPGERNPDGPASCQSGRQSCSSPTTALTPYTRRSHDACLTRPFCERRLNAGWVHLLH